MNENALFIVNIRQITYPNGQKLTRSVVPFDANDIAYFPKEKEINEVLPKIDEEYCKLMETFKKEGFDTFPAALDIFFKNVSESAIVGGLIGVLVEDLDVNVEVVEEALTNTSWFQQLIDYIRSEFRKVKKVDAIRYAESVRQLTEIFGSNYTLASLRSHGIEMKRSTIMALCRVAGETPKIKELIRKGLKLTIAFELPSLAAEDREKVAEELASKSYAEAKRYLKKVKTGLR